MHISAATRLGRGKVAPVIEAPGSPGSTPRRQGTNCWSRHRGSTARLYEQGTSQINVPTPQKFAAAVLHSGDLRYFTFSVVSRRSKFLQPLCMCVTVQEEAVRVTLGDRQAVAGYYDNPNDATAEAAAHLWMRKGQKEVHDVKLEVPSQHHLVVHSLKFMFA